MSGAISTFTARPYDAIVRDLLTTMAGGTVRETLTAPPEGFLVTPDLLAKRPVRQVSFLEGTVEVGAGATARRVSHRFTPADFELVASREGGDLDAIRFRPDGRRPLAGTLLTVNYFPVQAPPTELSDVSVGSVARTLLETVARELALSYQLLERIYDSAFVDTAEAGSLDRLVALVGVSRLPASRPLVALRFERAEREVGRITVPAGTAVSDAAGARYLTVAPLTLEPGETDREVDATGETDDTPLVDAGVLTRPETLVAGVAAVSNPRPARRLGTAEADPQLRRRAKSAMGAVGRGTRESLEFALAAMPEVASVRVVENPDDRPGLVRLNIAFTDTDDAAEKRVRARIDDVRPAGIHVELAKAARQRLTFEIALRLAGSSLAAEALEALKASIEKALTDYVGRLGPGGELRRSQLLRLVLADPRVTDATVAIRTDDPAAPPVEQLVLAPGTVAELLPIVWAPPPTFEDTAEAPPARAVASAFLPVLPAVGITLDQVRAAILVATASHLAGRAPDRPLSLDSLAAAIRDETRFALVRANALVTVEAGGRFVQLTDGVGSYAPAPNERIEAGTVEVELAEENG